MKAEFPLADVGERVLSEMDRSLGSRVGAISTLELGNTSFRDMLPFALAVLPLPYGRVAVSRSFTLGVPVAAG